ncbi:MAG: PEP-CTERM sorting domain-containing protein [Bryobacterales bacterium]|nr:PEP-CTERM sorting domain-containing protein [Bryobacterales bacterium]
MLRRFNLLLITAALAASHVAWGAVIGTETFSIDEAGFVPNTISGVLVHVGSGGNPDGHIQVRRDLGQPFFDLGALSTASHFTGNYAADGITGFTVDLNFHTDNFNGAFFRVRIDSSTNGWLLPLTTSFGTNTWNTYAFSFNPTWSDTDARAAGWITDQDRDALAIASPAFATVMSSVGYAEVRLANSTDTSALAGIDNFGLTGVPEPSSMVLMSLGLGVVALSRVLRRSHPREPISRRRAFWIL